MRVLLIEDDPTIGAAVRDHIAADGHGVDWAMDLDQARSALAVMTYGLILLDMSLPDGRGIDLLHEIRRKGDVTPVIIISAHSDVTVRIDGLNAGADDYLVKPFDLSELSARLAAVARRYGGSNNPEIVLGKARINLAVRNAVVDGAVVSLTAREWALLERLLATPNATISKPDLEDCLYAFGAEVESNTIEVYISRLRNKIGRDTIRTVRGVGYQIPQPGK